VPVAVFPESCRPLRGGSLVIFENPIKPVEAALHVTAQEHAVDLPTVFRSIILQPRHF
jgi:hypothetical protein